MSFIKKIKKVIVISLIIFSLTINIGYTARADSDTSSNTDSNKITVDNIGTMFTIAGAETDELSLQLEDFINNISTLSNEAIQNSLNDFLDKLIAKTPDERNNYYLMLAQAFNEGFGQIGKLPADDILYTLTNDLVSEKTQLLSGMLEGYKAKLSELGYSSILAGIDKGYRTLSVTYNSPDNTSYYLDSDLATLKTLSTNGFGLKIKVGKDVAYIPVDALEGIYPYFKDDSVTYRLIYTHDKNYKIAGDPEDTSTHVYSDYFDVKTFGYIFGAKSYYVEKDTFDTNQQNYFEIPSYSVPIQFIMDYSQYIDNTSISKMFSFDFSSYSKNSTIYTDNSYKIDKFKRIYVASNNTGLHGIGTFYRTFSDLKNHWAKENVEELASRRLVFGTSFENFYPDKSITRAEYATLLIRILGIQAKSYSGGFIDVYESDWYAGNIQAASEIGLINGYDGYFRPNEPITREEMAAVLMRAYSLVYGENVTGSTDKFEDKVEISSWALDSIGGAVEKGFIVGATESTFKPRALATRAESVTILLRFIRYAEAR